jgi:hypothetical protein
VITNHATTPLPTPPYYFTMRHHIPKEYKDLALHMSLNENVSDNDVHCYIGISPRAMRCLRKTYRETGETIRTPVSPGRPRLLDTLDALVSHSLLCLFSSHISQFLEGCIERQPDMLLVELQDQLHEVCGVVSLIGTIARTLHRQGFTMKRVSRSQTS